MNSNVEQFPNALLFGICGTSAHFFSRAMSLMRRVADGGGALNETRQPAAAPVTIEEALSGIRNEFMSGCGVRFRIFVKGRPRAVDPAIQEQIYPIAREALLNALRHSEAKSIEAEIDYVGRRLRVVVRDDGRGMDPRGPATWRETHRGLRLMRERAESIAAGLRISSRPGAGTEVEISAPEQMVAAACA